MLQSCAGREYHTNKIERNSGTSTMNMFAHGHHDSRGEVEGDNYPSRTDDEVVDEPTEACLKAGSSMVTPPQSPPRMNVDTKVPAKTHEHRVRFDKSREMVREIPHKSEFTQLQKSQMWYNVNEFIVMKLSRCMSLSRMVKRRNVTNSMPSSFSAFDNIFEDEGFNFGLETPAGRAFRKEQKQQQVSAVLDEQELQREEGSNDPELLADVSFHLSEENQRYATERGMAHANEVKMLQHDDSQQHDCYSVNDHQPMELNSDDDDSTWHQSRTVSSSPPCGMQHCLQQGTQSLTWDTMG